MNEFTVFIIACIVLLVALVTGQVYSINENAKTYKENCAAVKGTATFNGKYWECLK